MTKKIAILLSFLIIFTNIQTAYADEDYSINFLNKIDTTPPELTDISIDKTVVEAGTTSESTIKLSIKGIDNISGIDYISIDFRNDEYKTSLSSTMSRYDDYDESTDTFFGTIDVSEYTIPGTYSIFSIYVSDRTSNRRYYSKLSGNLNFDVSFVVLNDIVDTTPPELLNISLDNFEFDAPANLGISVKASDDISGVNSVSVTFYNKEDDYTLYSYSNIDYGYDEFNDIFIDTIEIESSTPPGAYKIHTITIFDKSGNYMSSSRNEGSIYFDLGFVVKNELINNTTPELMDISISEDILEAPATITLSVKVSDDISNVNDMSIYFYNNEYNHKLSTYFEAPSDYDESSDTLNLALHIDNSVPPGTYKIESMHITDKLNNSDIYFKELGNFDYDISFTIIDDDTIDLTTSTKNPNLIDDINNANDGSTILIGYASISNASSDIFKAIMGTDKKVIFQYSEIQWILNGKDITNPKAIDLNVEVNPILIYNGDNATEINKLVKDNPALVMNFENNGILPGKTLIKVKANHDLKEYLGTKGLYIYYFDNSTNKMNLVKENINIPRDRFIEFELTNNSDYVITNSLLNDTIEDTNDKVNIASENDVPDTSQFNDIDNHWAKDSILYLSSNNILSGTGENIFEPDTYMTRAMFVTVLGRIMDVDVSVKQSTFNDTVKNSWYDGYVAYANENNLLSGVGNNNFAPDAPLTREQMATIISNIIYTNELELPKVNEKVIFSDDDQISSWANHSVYELQTTGLMNGKADNMFDPKANTTRAEASVVLESVYKILHNLN